MPKPLLRPNITDHLDPLAVGMVNRHSPGAVRAAFGDDVARANPAVSMADVMANLWPRIGGTGRPDVLAMMTNDDFRKILSDTVTTAALASYILNFPAIMRISHETADIANFKPVTKVASGLFPTLVPPGEGGEVQYGEVGERGESYAAVMRSRMIELTVEALKNDNLGLLVQPALRIGEGVADTKASILAGLIEGNPELSDDTPVFHSSHGNLSSDGAVLDVSSLSVARLAMRRQKDVDGVRSIGVEPAFLVVPPELETAAEQVVAAITAPSVDEVNPFTGKLTPVVEHRLSDPKAWYVFTRPERQMSLEHGSVDGMPDPEIRTESPIGRHSVITRVSIAFGAGWVDYRGAYKNPGPSGG